MFDECTCPEGEEFATDCPLARGGIGHIKQCPVSGNACPCLPGSLSYAHCAVEASPDDYLDITNL